MKNLSIFLIVFLGLFSIVCSVVDATVRIVDTYPVYAMNSSSTGFDSMLGVLKGATKEKKFGDIEGYVYWQVIEDGGSKVQCAVYSEVEMMSITLGFVGFGSIRGTPDTGHTKQFAGEKVDKLALDKTAKVEVINSKGMPLELKGDRFEIYEEAPKDIWKKYGDKETFRFTVPDKPPYVLYTAMQKHSVHSGGGFDFGRFITFRDPNSKEKSFSLNEMASLQKQKTKASMTNKEMIAMFSPYAQAHGESETQFGKESDNTIRSVTVDTTQPKAPKNTNKKAAIERGEYNYGLLFAAEDVYTAMAGDTHEAVFYLSNSGKVDWYLQSPGESGRGTLMETDSDTDEARFSFSFSDNASGSYVITGVVTPASGPGYEGSYTVSVSTQSPSASSPDTTTPTTKSTPSSTTPTFTPAGGSYTATAGGSHTVNLTVPSGYNNVYWYIKAPGESGWGTNVSTTYGNGSDTTVSYTYSIPSGASGDYVLTAYIYLSDNTIVDPSYTVSVSSGSSPGSSPSAQGSSPSAPTSKPVPVSVKLQPGDGLYSLTVGDVHTADLKLGSAPSYVFWYIQGPWDTSPRLGYKDTSGNLTSQHSYSFANPGSYVISVSGTRASDGAAITGSYSIYVSQ